MGILDVKSPWEMRTSFWVLGIVLVVGAYLVPLALEVHDRKGKESALIDQWVGICSADHPKAACADIVDGLGEACVRQSRTVHRDEIVFQPTVFFECMNARNSADIVLSIPAPLSWERR